MPDLHLVAEYECVVDSGPLGHHVLAFDHPSGPPGLETVICHAFPNGARLKVTVEQLPDEPDDQALRRTA